MSIRKNSLYNLAGSLAPILVTLFTVPAYFRLIGAERYGVLVIAWMFLGYFSVFDLGLGRATAQKIATLKEATPDERAQVFWTALTLNAFFGIAGGLLLWPLANYFFGTHFKIQEMLRSEVLGVVPWIAAAVPIATTFGVLSGALQGREKFLSLNASNVLRAILYQVLPLGAALIHGPDLTWLVPAALIGHIAGFLIMLVQCYRYVPLNVAISVKRDLVAPLFRYGSWVTVSGILGPLLTTLDRFLIGSISGAKAVAYYTVPFNLAFRVSTLPASLSDTLFPRFSSASDEERHRLMDEALRALRVILTPVIIGGMVIMGPFLTWWVGADVAGNAAYVGEIIALGLWFNGQAYIPYVRLQAEGRPDIVAKCHLAEIVPYLAFLALALRAWGVVGAALAWSLRAIVDAILLSWLARASSRGLASLVVPLLLLGITTASILVFPTGSASRWIVGSCALLASLAWAWRAAPDSVKGLVRDGSQLLSCNRKA